VRDDARVVVLIDAGYGAQGVAQDRAGQQVAVVLDVRLGQRRAHAGPNAISGKALVFVSSGVGELLDIGGHAGEQ
jgi:hypothetical protein